MLAVRVFDIGVDDEGVHGIARLSLGLPIPSKHVQNPAQTFLHMAPSTSTRLLASLRASLVHNTTTSRLELGDHFEGPVVEELHKLIFTVAKIDSEPKYGEGLVGGGLGDGLTREGYP
jgi:hypothetical protein